jgi:hypothetical protein
MSGRRQQKTAWRKSTRPRWTADGRLVSRRIFRTLIIRKIMSCQSIIQHVFRVACLYRGPSNKATRRQSISCLNSSYSSLVVLIDGDYVSSAKLSARETVQFRIQRRQRMIMKTITVTNLCSCLTIRAFVLCRYFDAAAYYSQAQAYRDRYSACGWMMFHWATVRINNQANAQARRM